MLFNLEIEQLPLPQLRALQNARLKEQVACLAARVPFYQRKFAEAGLNPDTFRGLEDLPKLGFTRKADFWAYYPFGLFAVPETEVATALLKRHHGQGHGGRLHGRRPGCHADEGSILSGFYDSLC